MGAEYCGQPVGTFGDAAAFAFYPNKQITTGEGGMIVTDNPQIAGECRSMRNQGRSESSEWLSHTRLGYNYRLSDLHCALGLAQLERIQELLGGRARVAAAYSRQLAGASGLVLPAVNSRDNRSWFAYVVRVQGSGARRAAQSGDSQSAGTRASPPRRTSPPFTSSRILRRFAGHAARELAAHRGGGGELLWRCHFSRK